MKRQDLDPVRHARFFASVKHAGQMYSGGLPYTHHLAAVADLLEHRFGTNADGPEDAHFESGLGETIMLEAAWLHDVVEDTETKLKEIEEMFGEEVAVLVGAVSNESGPNRKVRNALTYPKIREAGGQAVRLKLADRIANVESGGKLVDMYKREYEDFRRALYSQWSNRDMWDHLDSLLGYEGNR